MSDKFTRARHKANYGPLAQKSLQSVLKRELMEQFGFENMGLIADALVKRFLEIVDEYAPEKVRLLPGQMLWLAVATDEKCGYGKPIYRCRMKPVVLTVISPEDLQSMAEERASFEELRPQIAARILKEAYSQGGVLALSDVAVILGMPAHAGARLVEQYRRSHPEEVLPHRGTVHDMGRTCTHKLQAINLKLKGLLTREIAARIHHDPSNVDRYQVDFERVYELYKDGHSTEQICFICQLSPTLVREYTQIIDNHVTEVESTTKHRFAKTERSARDTITN
jgi:hypothetical protein